MPNKLPTRFTNSNSPSDDAHIDSYVFRAIANYTYDWESWSSPTGELLWINAAVQRMTGFRPEECLEMDDYPLPLVAACDRGRIAAMRADAIAGGSGNDLEFQIAHRDGSLGWASVSWQQMYDDSQRLLGFRSSFRDITERRRLREELRLHNQHLEQLVQERTAKVAQLEEQRLKMEKLAALGQMAAGVAHEVNNPLAGIRNAFALFKDSLSADDENYELLELIDREIDRISSITHQMYQLYRPSQQTPRRFDVQRTVCDVSTLVQPLASEKNVTICDELGVCEPVGELKPTEVVLREGELKQVLLNVVRNAIQATPAASEVMISISTTADQVQIEVTDQGEGISPELASRIFDPFYSTKTATREGLGLGLSVSRSLTEAMGGKISITNRQPQGACLRIVAPRRMPSDD